MIPWIGTLLDFVMTKTRFRKWILECLRSSYVSIFVYGSSTEEFKMSRGLRQGDSLLSYLYVIAAEGFNKLMEDQWIKGILMNLNLTMENIN